MRKFLMTLLIVSLMVVSIGCGGTGTGGDDKPAIKVGSKPWTEQLILGTMTMQYLEGKGYEVEDRTGLGETPVLRPALHSDELDLYWEYTGTTLMVNMKSDVITDPVECYNAVKSWDAETNNVAWMDAGSANNTYVLLMRGDFAEENGLETITDLGEFIKAGNEVSLGSTIEFVERPDGIVGVEELYGFEFDRDLVKSMAAGLSYEALENEQIDVAVGFGTDGRIIAMNLQVLEDDQQFFPVYNPAPIVRQEVLDAYPELADDLNLLSSKMTNEALQDLNKQVDVDQLEPEEVAETFLRDNGLLE